MVNSSSTKTIKMRCPECLNFMIADICENGAIKGICPVCKSSVFSKQHSVRERRIRIVKQSK